MATHALWKKDELRLAKWIGGRRQSSRGVADADVISDDLTFECKARDIQNFPKWILEAYDQSELNKRLYPSHENFVAFFVHSGRGHKVRVFVAKEVELDEDTSEAIVEALLAATQYVKSDLEAATGTGEKAA